MRDFHIDIFWSDADGCYVADIPDLSYCSALGDTPREALEQPEVAKEAWLIAAREARKPMPTPSYRPAIYQVAG